MSIIVDLSYKTPRFFSTFQRLVIIISIISLVLDLVFIQISGSVEDSDKSENYWNIAMGFFSVFVYGIMVSIARAIIWLFLSKSKYYCGNCEIKLERSKLIENCNIEVSATSQSTKSVTTSSPSLGIANFGGRSGTVVGMSSSTSHVPVVLGRIKATFTCTSFECSAVNRWYYDSEVQVWNDVATGAVSNEILGKPILPK